ncbi:hypothetical protein DQ393_11940 [Rhizobium tropici]|uniref:Uncharacterized protein n=1 Tax=Rhizobium tropici TaxID=398 RepID=A0A329YKW5_RHITR|nr:hypothetical protein DQ393_11940 [Rhizobium tropici]
MNLIKSKSFAAVAENSSIHRDDERPGDDLLETISGQETRLADSPPRSSPTSCGSVSVLL